MMDILFVYCKLHEDIGYRQGMHEIVAPILWVVDRDSISVGNRDALSEDEKVMHEVLNSEYIEHDTFSLFEAVMRSARAWYELGEEGEPSGGEINSPIVEKSKMVHEDLLMSVDPQLGQYLKELDVLPQVFLMYDPVKL